MICLYAPREKWGIPVLSLPTYLKFWTVVCYAVTLWLIFVKKEDKESPEDEVMDLVKVYRVIWGICKLPRKWYTRIITARIHRTILWQMCNSSSFFTSSARSVFKPMKLSLH